MRLLDPRHHAADRATPRVSGQHAARTGQQRSSARTVAISPPPCSRREWRAFPRGPTDQPATALVWDLRSPASPPVRVPVGLGLQGMALSPDGRTLYTSWPLTAYDVASGTRVWRRPDVRTFGLELNSEGTLLAVGGDGDGEGTVLVDAADGRDGPHAAGPPRRGLRPPVLPRRLAGGVGLQGRRPHRLGLRHRPVTRTVGHPRPVRRRLRPGQRPRPRRRRRLDAPQLGPVRAADLPAADDRGGGRRRVRARRPRPGREPGGLQLARRPGARDGSGSSTSPPAVPRRRPQPRWTRGRKASAGRAARGIHRGGSTWRSATSSAPPGVRPPGSTLPADDRSGAATSGRSRRWRTWTRGAACSWATTPRAAPAGGRPFSTPRPFVPGASPSAWPRTAVPLLSVTGARRWSTRSRP